MEASAGATLRVSRSTGIVIDPNSYAWQTQGDGAAPGTTSSSTRCTSARSSTKGLSRAAPLSFASVASRLAYLADRAAPSRAPGDADLGVRRLFAWGYNGAYPFSVESIYGGVDQFKYLVDEAHARGIAVFLDVIYNRLGPQPTWTCGSSTAGTGDGWGGIFLLDDVRALHPLG